MRRKAHVPFGKGLTEKDPNHGHLAGGLLHSAGGYGETDPGQPGHRARARPHRDDTPGSCPTSDHCWSATQARLLAPRTMPATLQKIIAEWRNRIETRGGVEAGALEDRPDYGEQCAEPSSRGSVHRRPRAKSR